MEAKGVLLMVLECKQIPPLVTLQEYNGDYFTYEEAIYALFTKDFVDARPIFKGKALGLKRHPLFKGREATFWHIISEGPIENVRTPDLRRYERILWPKVIIEICSSTCKEIKIWKNIRKDETRILLWCERIEYLVILADRGSYILFWTSYPVFEEHIKRKLRKEYYEYIANPF
jgi:hypothetical protein